MRRATAVAALGAALVCAGCGDSKPMVTGVTNAAPAPVPTPVKPALPVETDPGLIVSGPIIVEHQVDVTAQRDGLLLKVLVDAPARVKAGAVLAQMDDRQI
ncbi:MAG: hypothetical protein WBR26_14635, partial [Candidatus Acidiferrum sp.]